MICVQLTVLNYKSRILSASLTNFTDEPSLWLGSMDTSFGVSLVILVLCPCPIYCVIVTFSEIARVTVPYLYP